MDVVWCPDRRTFDATAADRVGDVLAHKPDAVLALPTGATPLGLYAELAERTAAQELSFAAAMLFNLDEYVGLGARDPLSYASYLERHLLRAVGAAPDRVRLLRGDAADLAAECRDYDAAIARAGGIDLAVLGLGANGHIAFNEPGTDWRTTTHVVALSGETRAAQQRLSGAGACIPERGLTVGIATLCAAREVLLLVAGSSKREALTALMCGPPDPRWPVTSLVGHPRLMVGSALDLRELR
jgi:glucosamine-6-phosphate deaminase